MHHDVGKNWDSEELHIAMHSTHKFAVLHENFHFDCVIKTIGRYCQLSRAKQIKPHYIKT